MNKILLRNDVVNLIAKKASFAKVDVETILDTLVEVFENAVENGDTLKIRGMGKLYKQRIPPRKGMKGENLPETERIIFRLSENIRYFNKNKK
jgi:nucleoid DNA-binding protein